MENYDWIDYQDGELFAIVKGSNPDGPNMREASAYEELISRGYSEAFIARQIEREIQEEACLCT